MTRKVNRQNRQPSIDSAIKRPTKTGPNLLIPESERPSDYHFDIDEYSNENLCRVETLIRMKGRGKSWDFFDPEDLANKAMLRLWKFVSKNPEMCREKITIDKMLSTVVVRIWIDAVRREFRKRNVRGNGSVCVSLFEALDGQVADLDLEFEIALRELLEHVKAVLSSRQQQIVDLRLEKRNQLDISLKLSVSEATVKREIASIKKAIVIRLGRDFEQRATSNEVATRLEKIVLHFLKIHELFSPFLAT